MNFDLDQNAIQAVFDLPDNEGAFAPSQQQYLRQLGAQRPAVFMAFPPKAAGTFLRQAVIEASGGDLVRVVYAQGGRDAQPYMPTFLGYYLGGLCAGPLVAHVHMQALPSNVSFLNAFGIRPIIMLRSVRDMLVSYRDMLDADPSSQRQDLNIAIPEDWTTRDARAKGDFLVDMLGPWYASYYATWLALAQQAGSQILVLGYGELLAAPQDVLHRILLHSGIDTSLEECASTMGDVWIDRSRLRFNQGREGRGATQLSDAQQDRIKALLSQYPVLRDRLAEIF